MRALTAVLAEQRGSLEERSGVGDSATPDAASGPGWDAALEAACAQVGPLAVGLLTAVAEVLDRRRPPAHLMRLCPAPLVERVRAGVARSREFPQGARVRGLRLCPVVGASGVAVEVAAALCGQGRARAAAARFELDATRTWRVTELAVL
ncbi:Rv3235 family protein [Actinomycetospora endophytica]|uniref:Rv3235 family protein n=1 Tax=Actinomycetospora endophytica TaxID=2291215 RepID=A0ABS8PGT3_9PSEU|nr:Rv3235 family protein [Actinomycetospora endophytica]MCD2197466.1 Rv3235 family protein [Actinomycetospora endophytica]